MGVFFPTKRDQERWGGTRREPGRGAGKARGQRRDEMSPFQGEKENESKRSRASSVQGGC